MRPNIDTIRARRADIAHQLDELKAEDAELASVETILVRLAGGGARKAPMNGKRRGRPPGSAKTAKPVARKVNGAAKKAGRGRRASGAGSQRELVLAALKKSNPAWMNVKQIIAHVKETNGVSLPPRSLSPLLSNLKRDGVIVRNGRLVASPERAKGR